MKPSIKSGLFLATSEIIIDHFKELKLIPLKGVEIQTDPELSDEAMKYGLELLRWDKLLFELDEDISNKQ